MQYEIFERYSRHSPGEFYVPIQIISHKKYQKLFYACLKPAVSDARCRAIIRSKI
jgi:hypothetical protein